MFRTRFAPSPTGPLHLGHAYSALLAFEMAQAQGGEFLLRIEDIDRARARPEWEAQIYEDLAWLGLSWPKPVMRQSERLQIYEDVLQNLWDRKLIYACRCRRRDIAEALSAPQEGSAAPMGPDGLIYPGTCRQAGIGREGATPPKDCALRLDMARAIKGRGSVTFEEHGQGPQGQQGQISTPAEALLTGVGDIVLARRDMGTSYHLSVVLDDAAQGVTHVVRGQDLFEATMIHAILQDLLGLPRPKYHHHRLIRDSAGKRLAKRDDARAIALYRREGKSRADIRAMIGL